MRLSRSKVELFLDCPRCFYLDVSKGIKRPSGPPFNLNLAVDTLLKREFDYYRERQEVPTILQENGLEMIPYKNDLIETWRSNFKGISCKYYGVEFFGAVDDIWINKDKELVVVDYKASAKTNFSGLEGSSWKEQYKRQLSFYQWLLVKNGFKVAKSAYFVFCNADTRLSKFENKLSFETHLVGYQCETDWIEPCLEKMLECLKSGLPKRGEECRYCQYAFKANENLGFDF